MSPRWVKGAQGSLDNVRLAGAANQSQRSQSGTLNTQYPWSWTRGWRMKNRAGREAAEMTTGEVGVGLKRWKVQRVTSQQRWPLEQSCHVDHTSRLGNYQHPCFFFFLHLLLFLQRSPLAKRRHINYRLDTTATLMLLPAGLSVSLHGLHTLVPLPYPLEKKLLRLDRVKVGNVWWWSVSTSWHGCAPPVVTDSSAWERKDRRQAAGCDLQDRTHRQRRSYPSKQHQNFGCHSWYHAQMPSSSSC